MSSCFLDNLLGLVLIRVDCLLSSNDLCTSQCNALGGYECLGDVIYICIRIPTMGYMWMSESYAFRRIHAHFCCKICHNSSRSILLYKAMSEYRGIYLLSKSPNCLSSHLGFTLTGALFPSVAKNIHQFWYRCLCH